ncbi:hypothetical protein [Hydrotalea sp.]|uniref:hypothetical protein n=1 Tax=Hydrotalea sp. TaxID=2881279 RepID=UPI00262BB985|nr:hypothetical protein [Hydrotalea sp.]
MCNKKQQHNSVMEYHQYATELGVEGIYVSGYHIGCSCCKSNVAAITGNSGRYDAVSAFITLVTFLTISSQAYPFKFRIVFIP